MEFVEAKNAIGNFQRFFRALNALDEVLATALKARDELTQYNQRIELAKSSLQSFEEQIASLSPLLETKKEQQKVMMDEMKAAVEAKRESLEAKVAVKIAEGEKKVADLNGTISFLETRHAQIMEEYASQEETAKAEAEKWAKKLEDAKAAFERFKSGLA